MSEPSDIARKWVAIWEQSRQPLSECFQSGIDEATAELRERLAKSEALNELLCKQRNKSEAACAAMRDLLEKIRQVASGEQQVAVDDTCGMAWIAGRIYALSTDAGKGWVPIEDVRPLVELMENRP
jgi:vacuolar-type H+-ATPase subunit I/STV1